MWPKYGGKLIFFTILYLVSSCSTASMMYVKIGMDLGQSPQSLIPCIAGTVIQMAFSFFMSFNMVLFVLTWIEKFGNFCTNFYTVDEEMHVKRCLHIFESLQNGLGKVNSLMPPWIYFWFCFVLGATLFLWFLCFQVSTITLLFLTISSNLSTIFEPWQKIANSIAYFVSAIYCTSTMYFITLTTETSFNKMKNLVDPLQQKMIKERDATEQMKIKLLIEKVENMKTLNGNGYFEISRGTLTSIVSISITYLIILLQFRTA